MFTIEKRMTAIIDRNATNKLDTVEFCGITTYIIPQTELVNKRTFIHRKMQT